MGFHQSLVDDDTEARLPPKVVIVSVRERHTTVESLGTILAVTGASVRPCPEHDYAEMEGKAALGRAASQFQCDGLNSLVTSLTRREGSTDTRRGYVRQLQLYKLG